MRQTLAFDNTLEHWKTRYSYTPSCMMHLNKLFFSSPMRKDESDQKKIFYRHNDSSVSLNTFYDSADHSSPSALAVSFNGFTAKSLRSAASNTTSSNKLFKSFSISGLNGASSVTGLSLGASSFIVNNQDNTGSSAEGFHRLTPLKRMGNSVYGEVGKDLNMSGMNIKAIGKIKEVYVWLVFDGEENKWDRLSTTAFEQTTIPAKIIDEDGFEVAPDADSIIGESPTSRLYAFEIEYFLSKNPLPASVLGGDPGEGVKFFTKVGATYQDIGFFGPAAINTYVPFEDFVADSANIFNVDYELSPDFGAGTQFSSYLSYGDPYQDETNTFKKGNFLFIKTKYGAASPHIDLFHPSVPNSDLVALQNGVDVYLYAMTPGNINGSDAHGSFADAFVVLGNSKFEVSSLQVEFEFTEYDHGGITGTASKAKTK